MLKAKDIMTTKVITVTPEQSVAELAETLWKNRISGAPVVDSDNTLISVVTESDLIHQSKRMHIPTVLTILDSVIFLESPSKMERDIKKMTGTTVGDLKASQLITVSLETTLEEIATMMAEKQVHTLPVVDESGALCGIIGKSDIIRTLAKNSG